MVLLITWTVLPVLLCLTGLAAADIEDNAEFLFENAKICGDPFADPIWIPTLDLCKIQCDKETEYCVESEELKQMCKKRWCFLN